MRLKTILVVITIIGSTLFFVLSEPTSEYQINTVTNTNLQTVTDTVDQNVTVMKQHSKFVAVKRLTPEPHDVEELIPDYNTLWVVTKNNNEKPFPFQNPRKIKYRHLILNNTIISTLKAGDEFTFFIPQAEQHYYGVITHVKLTTSGVTSYYGSLIDHSRQFSFSITQGPNSTYARFTTPEGRYALESFSKDAWISNTLDESSTLDYSLTDVVKFTTQKTTEF